MLLNGLQASRACAASCLAAAGLVGPMSAQAQPAPASAASAPAAEMTPTERAQRDADKVFKWILIHSDKPRKAGANRTDDKREEKPAVVTRAKPAVRTAESAPAASVPPEPVITPTEAVPTAPDASPPVETLAILDTAPAPAAVAAEALDEPLTPLFRADPQFPTALLRTLHKGQVQVRFTVQPDGSVAEPVVVTTSNPKLNASALAAVAQWRFMPLRRPQLAVVALGFDLD